MGISKLLRPGGTFMFYEPHIVEYLTLSNSTGHVEYFPKEDGTAYKYFEDEGKPRTVRTLSFNCNPNVVVKDLTINPSSLGDQILTSCLLLLCLQLRIHMNSGTPIEITNRFYTLSFWVTSLLEAGFQISQFHEPHVNPKDVPSDAPSFMRYYAEWPSAMFWVCTKVSS